MEEAVERLVCRHRDELACVILDPRTGILPVRKEFVQAVRRITAENEVLLILDEVVGFRVARGGAQEALWHQPGPVGVRQTDRRRFPGRRIWRPPPTL